MAQILKPRIPVINWNHPITKGLVLDAEFFERGGTTNIIDVASKALGSVSGTLSWASDLYGTVGSFSRSQYVNFPDSTILGFTKGCSVNALVNLNNGGANNQIISKRSAFNATGIPFEVNFDTVAGFSWRVIGNGHILTSNTFSQDTWYNFLCTWDGATQAIYANGKFVTSQAASGTITTNSVTATIGGLPGAGGEQFGGKIAFVRVWNRGLTAQEAKQLAIDPWQIHDRTDFYQPLNSLAAASSNPSGSMMMLGIGS